MSQDKHNKRSRRDRLRQLVNGMQLHMQNVTELTIAGVVHKTADIIAGIESDIAASDQSEAMHGAWLAQVTQEKASHEQIDPQVRGVEQYVRLTYENAPNGQAILANFGMSPRKKRPVSTAKKSAAVIKRKATRQARHTMGAVQKSGIHGVPEPSAEPAPPGVPPASPPAGVPAGSSTK
jgi:hypothetical protein